MSHNSAPYRFLFSAGGSGGHIFPALAVANALRLKYPDAEFLFIGANGKMEMEKVPQAGYPIVGLNISGMARKLSPSMLVWPFKLIGSLIKAQSAIRKFKPSAALGFGGFASGPALYMASMMGVPSLIQEQNSYGGVTNRILAGKVRKVCVAYDDMQNFFPSGKIIKTGNPVRKEILDFENDHAAGLAHFGFVSDKPVLFAFGGSQGALAINEALYANLDNLRELGLQVLWQCGNSFLDKAKSKIQALRLEKQFKVFDFIYDMDKAYQAADFIIARSGAISISELCLVGKAVIFVPLPSAAEDHQTKNAMALVNKNAARLLDNSQLKEKLISEVKTLLEDKNEQILLGNNIKALAIKDATERIVEQTEKLLI